MHTAERYAHELAVHRLGDAHGDAGLAGARRADKADKATLDIRAELLDGKVFYDAILDLLKAEVLIVEELSGFFKVDGLRGLLAPRQLKAGIEIAAQDCRLGRAEGLLHQTRQLLIELLLDLVGRGKRADFPAVFADIVRLPVLAELRLNYLHLLAEIVLALVLVHLLLRCVGQFPLKLKNVQLAAQELAEPDEPSAGVQLFEQALLFVIIQIHIVRYVICDAARLVDREHTYELLGHGFGILGQIVVIHREAAADKRNNAILADALRLVAGGHQDGVVHRRYTPCRSVPYAPPAHDKAPPPSRGGCCSAAGGSAALRGRRRRRNTYLFLPERLPRHFSAPREKYLCSRSRTFPARGAKAHARRQR